MISHRGISVITPLPFGGGVGGGAIIFLTFVCSVHLCSSVRKRTHSLDEMIYMQIFGEFFSHRTHRFNRTYLRTVSNSQNASGIQISQNVIAKEGCWVLVVRC